MSKGSIEMGRENGVDSFVGSIFPKGMKVLVVDDNIVELRITTELLRKCEYQVTSTNNPHEALILLEKNEDNFDLVLTDVCMEEIDGFRLLEAGLKHDIPVIMMSVYDDENVVKRGVMHGARNYLAKPIQLTEIKLIWQHVFRKIHEKCANKDNENQGCKVEYDNEDQNEKTLIKRGGNKIGSTSTRRERIRWIPDLHADFVAVIADLGGIDKAVPKKILERLAKKYELTREQVASHLQKYRKNLSNKALDGNQTSKCDNANYHSLMVPTSVVSIQPIGPTLARHHLSVVDNGRARAATQDYALLNNFWAIDHLDQPQPLQVRPSQVTFQQPMQFSRTLVGSNNLAQVNHHPQQRQLMPNGDYRTMHANSFDSFGMQVTDEIFNNRHSITTPSNDANGFLADGNYKALFEDFSM